MAKWNGTAWECSDATAAQPLLDVTVASWDGDGDIFADGITVNCPAGYKRVGCGHSCVDGPHDTNSWPVDGEGCRGHEANDGSHGGYCHLYAICARMTF